MELPPRSVTLVLCLPDGSVLGALPSIEVPVPWWQEVGPVVDAAREVAGIEVTVLRLLGAASDTGCGGPVTYLAEVDTPVGSLTPWPEPVGDHPLRLPYARPGGPAADLAWADAALTRLGRPRTAAPRQVRTWNLSSLWRLPTGDGDAWLKVVPPFFAHEGAVITALGSPDVPTLLATDGPRVLMEGLPGADLYEADGEVLTRMVDLLVGLQAQWVGCGAELLDLGLPDWRGEPFAAAAAAMLERSSDQLDLPTRRTCERVVAGLPARFAALEACGVPDTLVHGDFHPGNLIGHGTRLALLDWGDCGLGNPLLDRSAFVPRVPQPQRADVLAHWDGLWRAAVLDPSRFCRGRPDHRQRHGQQDRLVGLERDPAATRAVRPSSRGRWLRCGRRSSTTASCRRSSRASGSTTRATPPAGCAPSPPRSSSTLDSFQIRGHSDQVPTSSDLERSLRAADLKVTRQRVAVLGAVRSHPHADTESIITTVRDELGEVSHQAVYDVLRALTAARLVRRIEPAGSVARYESRVADNHHHVVCRSCGVIADVDCAVGETPCLTASQDHGFVIDEAEVTYWGLCLSCSTTPLPTTP